MLGVLGPEVQELGVQVRSRTRYRTMCRNRTICCVGREGKRNGICRQDNLYRATRKGPKKFGYTFLRPRRPLRKVGFPQHALRVLSTVFIPPPTSTLCLACSTLASILRLRTTSTSSEVRPVVHQSYVAARLMQWRRVSTKWLTMTWRASIKK